MEFEGVGTIPVCCISFKVFWEIDDLNGLKRTFLDTNTTTFIDIESGFEKKIKKSCEIFCMYGEVFDPIVKFNLVK